MPSITMHKKLLRGTLGAEPHRLYETVKRTFCTHPHHAFKTVEGNLRCRAPQLIKTCLGEPYVSSLTTHYKLFRGTLCVEPHNAK